MTPIYYLGPEQNNALYIKREDFIPFSFGGNKARKAALFFEEIDKGGYDCVVTYGSGSSNHCRVVANQCCKRGIPCYIISPEEDAAGQTFNSQMMELFGAEIEYVPLEKVHETIEKKITDLRNRAGKPYFIEGGGHGRIGTQAYVECFEEITKQEAEAGIYFDFVFFASGTGTTQAGLVCGQLLHHDQNKKIVGISIARKNPRGRAIVLDSIRSFFGGTVQDDVIETTIKSALDRYSGIYKLGLWVKDDISGIGTLTYIKKEDYRFGALGHAICDNDTKTIYNINSGEMYPCTVLGIKKGTKGKAGELKGLFFQGKNNKLGLVDNNSEAGVFGNITKEVKDKEVLKAGGRLYAKPGKAYIKSAIDGELKDYEIEIIKTNYQSSSNEKSMVIRVTDKELLQKTGGIIQGMSGSPIIQNGYIIGAVTHVFINDPTRGFCIYLDWMINQ